MPVSASRVIFILIIFSVFCGCASNTSAPISDAEPIPSHRIKEHVVAPGETLYAIAWRYGLDYRDLAKANNIGGSYQIRSGQVLSLRAPSPGTPSAVASQPAARPPPSAPPAAQPKAPPPPPERSKKPTVQPPVAARSTQPEGAIRWQWPLRGPILSPFGGNGGLNRGIDIRGNLGEPVLAAADGEVVYSGSGLRGYGNLLIVKHSDKYLSAYAHNRVLLVAEGDRVKGGQKIAEVGQSGTNVTKLHFEIRNDGQPVDPQKYLP